MYGFQRARDSHTATPPALSGDCTFTRVGKNWAPLGTNAPVRIAQAPAPQYDIPGKTSQIGDLSLFPDRTAPFWHPPCTWRGANPEASFRTEGDPGRTTPIDTKDMEIREMPSSLTERSIRLRSVMAAGVLLAVSTAGCAHVKRDELAAELAQVRNEIQVGDEGVEARLRTDMTGLEGRMEQRIAALESGLRTLEGEFATTVERFNTAIRFNAPVHFDYDAATVRAEDQPVLDRFADVVQEYYTGTVITVEGFTDPAGSAEYNRRLGEARASAVRDYLVGQGIPAENLRVVSYGEDSARQLVPGAYGDTGDAWQNRRVAMVIDFAPFAASQQQYNGDDEF